MPFLTNLLTLAKQQKAVAMTAFLFNS